MSFLHFSVVSIFLSPLAPAIFFCYLILCSTLFSSFPPHLRTGWSVAEEIQVQAVGNVQSLTSSASPQLLRAATTKLRWSLCQMVPKITGMWWWVKNEHPGLTLSEFWESLNLAWRLNLVIMFFLPQQGLCEIVQLHLRRKFWVMLLSEEQLFLEIKAYMHYWMWCNELI